MHVRPRAHTHTAKVAIILDEHEPHHKPKTICSSDSLKLHKVHFILTADHEQCSDHHDPGDKSLSSIKETRRSATEEVQCVFGLPVS